MTLRWKISQFIFLSESVTSICEVSCDVFVSDGWNMWLKATAWRRLLQPKSWADLNFSGPHLESMGNTVFATEPSLVWTQHKIFKSVTLQHWWLELSWSWGLKNNIFFFFDLVCVCAFNVHYWKEMSIAKMRKILQSAMLSKNYEFNEGESRFQKKQTKKYL